MVPLTIEPFNPTILTKGTTESKLAIRYAFFNLFWTNKVYIVCKDT